MVPRDAEATFPVARHGDRRRSKSTSPSGRGSRPPLPAHPHKLRRRAPSKGVSPDHSDGEGDDDVHLPVLFDGAASASAQSGLVPYRSRRSFHKKYLPSDSSSNTGGVGVSAESLMSVDSPPDVFGSSRRFNSPLISAQIKFSEALQAQVSERPSVRVAAAACELIDAILLQYPQATTFVDELRYTMFRALFVAVPTLYPVGRETRFPDWRPHFYELSRTETELRALSELLGQSRTKLEEAEGQLVLLKDAADHQARSETAYKFFAFQMLRKHRILSRIKAKELSSILRRSRAKALAMCFNEWRKVTSNTLRMRLQAKFVTKEKTLEANLASAKIERQELQQEFNQVAKDLKAALRDKDRLQKELTQMTKPRKLISVHEAEEAARQQSNVTQASESLTPEQSCQLMIDLADREMANLSALASKWKDRNVGMLMGDKDGNFDGMLAEGADAIVVRWLNHQLAASRHSQARRIEDLATDLKDGVSYIILMHQIAPDQVSLDGLKERSVESRANMVVELSEALHCDGYITPQAISSASPTNHALHFMFLSALFLRYPSLKLRVGALHQEKHMLTELKRSWASMQGDSVGQLQQVSLAEQYLKLRGQLSATEATLRESAELFEQVEAKINARHREIIEQRLASPGVGANVADAKEIEQYTVLNRQRFVEFHGESPDRARAPVPLEKDLRELEVGLSMHYDAVRKTFDMLSAGKKFVDAGTVWVLIKNTRVRPLQLPLSLFRELHHRAGWSDPEMHLTVTTRHSPEITPQEFVEILIRVSSAKYSSLETPAKRMTKYVQADLMPLSARGAATAETLFWGQVHAPSMRSILNERSKELHKIFHHYAKSDPQDKSPTLMSELEFLQMAKDAKLVDNTLTLPRLKNVFRTVKQMDSKEIKEREERLERERRERVRKQKEHEANEARKAKGEDEELAFTVQEEEEEEEDVEAKERSELEEMVYPEFLEAVVAVCMFKVPDPFEPLPTRVQTFLQTVLLPAINSKVKGLSLNIKGMTGAVGAKASGRRSTARSSAKSSRRSKK